MNALVLQFLQRSCEFISNLAPMTNLNCLSPVPLPLTAGKRRQAKLDSNPYSRSAPGTWPQLANLFDSGLARDAVEKGKCGNPVGENSAFLRHFERNQPLLPRRKLRVCDPRLNSAAVANLCSLTKRANKIQRRRRLCDFHGIQYPQNCRIPGILPGFDIDWAWR